MAESEFVTGSTKPARNAQSTGRASRRESPLAPTYGERPAAPWHPLPLSELLILVGMIASAVGFVQVLGDRGSYGLEKFPPGASAALAGIGAMAVGTVEVTMREHLSGYRSHATILAAIPVLLFHTVIVFGVSQFTTFPRFDNIPLFAVDLGLGYVLWRALRARFLNARTLRVSGR